MSLWPLTFPHARIDEHVWPNEPQEDAEVANRDGDDGSVSKQCRHGVGVVHADGSNSFQGRVAIEDRVRERHAPARVVRLLTVVNYDGVAGDEQAPGDSRADLADTANQDSHRAYLAKTHSDQSSGNARSSISYSSTNTAARCVSGRKT